MAVIDVPGFVADLKEHAVDHGFHVHDERHFVETYSLHQAWEVDLHPEEACDGPIDLHLELRVDPRVLLAFEDAVHQLPDPDDDAARRVPLPARCSPGACRRCPYPPDLLVLATELAGIGGIDLPDRGVGHRLVRHGHRRPRAQPVARGAGSRSRWRRCIAGEEILCDTLDRCRAVSLFLLDRAPAWLGEG